MITPDTIMLVVDPKNRVVVDALKTLCHVGFWESLGLAEKDFLVTHWRENDMEQIRELDRFAVRQELYGALSEVGNLLTEKPEGE